MREDHNKFEQWLQTSTDPQRMYPDDSVWNRIHHRLHRRKWYPLALLLLLFTSASMTWIMIDQPASTERPIAASTNKGNTAGLDQKEEKETSTPRIQDKIPFKTSNPNTHAESFKFQLAAPSERYKNTDATVMPVENKTILQPTTKLAIAEDLMLRQSKEIAVITNNSSDTEMVLPIELTDVSSNATAEIISSLAVNTQPKKEVDVNDLLPEQYQTIESVVNTYKGKGSKKSWNLQLSVSPTVSYRQLIENTSALQAARTMMSPAPALAAPELETVVEHKPNLGIQFGLSASRPLTDRFRFVAGLQFNVNKYDIRAYRGTREVATVGLNNGGGTGTVSTFTNYRSSEGMWAKWLANYYFSASAPIGFQYRIAGNKKWSWGMGSTIQPTYILNNQAYVLSADYKNYLEVPSLVRRWNFNGQLETFIGFQNGKTRWTLGPQARYQILSSFEKAYPVQEHLFDIGIKLGVGL